VSCNGGTKGHRQRQALVPSSDNRVVFCERTVTAQL
jgi:hypothetical protein